jgi:hypothetical protein
MKTPAQLIDELHLAGAMFAQEGGELRLRGAKISEALKSELREQRDAVVAEWHRRQDCRLDRYAEVPTGDVPLFGQNANLSHKQGMIVVHYAFRQPRPVHAWVMGRTGEYHKLGLPLGQDEVAACLDLLCWQRNAATAAAVEWLAGIEECADDLKRINADSSQPASTI